MRIAAIVVGVILLAAGIWVVVGSGSYQTTDTVMKIGSASLEASHDKAIPQWAGIAGIVVGGVLVIGGFFSGRKR